MEGWGLGLNGSQDPDSQGCEIAPEFTPRSSPLLVGTSSKGRGRGYTAATSRSPPAGANTSKEQRADKVNEVYGSANRGNGGNKARHGSNQDNSMLKLDRGELATPTAGNLKQCRRLPLVQSAASAPNTPPDSITLD